MKDAKKVVDLWENDLVFDAEKAAEIAKNEGVEKAIAYSLRIFQNNQIVLTLLKSCVDVALVLN